MILKERRIPYLFINLKSMKKTTLLFTMFLSGIIFLSSCGGGSTKQDYSKEVDEGTFSENTFHSPTLGWTMEFPNNWLITKKASIQALDERSKLAAEDSVSDMSGVKLLLAFHKNFDNSFQSNMQLFEGKSTQDYYDVTYGMHEMIYNNYLDQRTPLDTSNVTIQIGAYKFDAYEINLFDKNQKNFANQLLITGVVKNQFMSVTIVYNNKEDKEKMLNLFKASKFE